MKHAVTRTLYDYWTRLRGERTAPARFEIEPGDIRHILGDTFILEAVDRGTYTFRLAGTRLCSAYCRELKGRNMLDLWHGKDREAMASLMAAIVEDGAAAIIGLDATNERGQSMPVEIILLPLAHDGPQHTRILGCFAPLEQPYWIGTHAVVRQPIHSLRLIWPEEQPTVIRRGDDIQDRILPPAEPRPLRTAAVRAAPAPRPAVTHELKSGRQVGHLRVLDGGRERDS
jgi:hypothetical protein